MRNGGRPIGMRRWPIMLSRDAGALCVVLGRNEDRDAARDVRGINLVGQTDLMMLIGVLSHCRALVANDSGALHLAAALGVSVTGIYGPTDERYSTPLMSSQGSATTGDGHFGTGVLSPMLPGRLSDRPSLHEKNLDRPGIRLGSRPSRGDSVVTKHRAVFLDRDGTMIEDVGYLDRLERLKLFPYTVDAVRLLNRGGFQGRGGDQPERRGQWSVDRRVSLRGACTSVARARTRPGQRSKATITVRTRHTRRWSDTASNANAANRSPV